MIWMMSDGTRDALYDVMKYTATLQDDRDSMGDESLIGEYYSLDKAILESDKFCATSDHFVEYFIRDESGLLVFGKVLLG